MRSRGFPYFVPIREWRRDLLSRAAPAMAAVVAFDVCDAVLSWVPGRSLLGSLGLAAAGAILVLVPIAAVVATAVLVSPHRRPRAQRRWIGLLASGLVLFVDPWLSRGLVMRASPLTSFVGNAVFWVVVTAFVWSGLASIGWWTVKAAVQQLPSAARMTSRALPLLIVVVIFAFYSPSIWQMADGLSTGDAVFAVGIFIGLGFVFVLPRSGGHARSFDAQMSGVRRRALLRMSGLRPSQPDPGEPGPPLRRLEVLNTRLIVILVQGVQVGIFAFVTFLFFHLLAGVTMKPALVVRWIGHAPAPVILLDLFPLPTSRPLATLAAFLSSIAGLNFLFAIHSDDLYRRRFYTPLFNSLRQALVVRGIYRRLPRRGHGARHPED